MTLKFIPGFNSLWFPNTKSSAIEQNKGGELDTSRMCSSRLWILEDCSHFTCPQFSMHGDNFRSNSIFGERVWLNVPRKRRTPGVVTKQASKCFQQTWERRICGGQQRGHNSPPRPLCTALVKWLCSFSHWGRELFSPLLESGLACDFLWTIDCGRNDVMPVPRLGLKGPGVLPFVVSEPWQLSYE